MTTPKITHAAIVTAIAAAGLLTASPAYATPLEGPSSHCTQFGFNGPFIVTGHPAHNDGDWQVSFTANGTTAGTGPAAVVFDGGQRVSGHVVAGGRIGGRNVKFRVQYDDKPNNFWDFTGTVSDDGLVHDGSEVLVGGDLPASWQSTRPLDCLANDVPVITGVPGPNKPPQDMPAPPKVAPTNAVTMTFTKQGLTETVDFTNKADLAGKCTYVASPVSNGLLPTINRSFSIGAKGPAQLTVPAPPIFTTYHAVASCHGTFDGNDVEFGHVEADVAG